MMTRSLRRRIWESLAAATFARVVQIGYVFALVPLLLSVWGIELYGEWIILTAFASFASLANVGVVQASASEIMLAASGGRHDQASRIAITTLLASATLILIVLMGLLTVFHFVDIKTFFGLTMIGPDEAIAVIMLAVAGILLSILLPPLSAALSVVVGNAMSTVVATLTKIGELCAIAAIIFASGGGPKWVTSMLAISVIASLVIHLILVRRFAPWLLFDLRQFDLSILRCLMHPSFAQILIYVSTNIFAVQLPRIILGHLAGPAAVGVFTIVATFARTARTFTSLFSQSLQIEMARAFAEKRRAVLVRMIESLCRIHLWSSIGVVVTLALLSRPIFSQWTHGKVAFDLELYVLLGIGGILGSYGDVFTIFLIGINRIFPVAIGHCLATAIGLGVASMATPELSIYSMAAALVLPEIFVTIIGIVTISRLLCISRSTLISMSIRWPLNILWEELARMIQRFR
jgi:O-antigen/teichoic acid export membrane protein